MRALILVCSVLVGCNWVAKRPIPEDLEGQCSAFCDHIDELDCDGADGSSGPDGLWNTSDDVSCEVVCVETAHAGFSIDLTCGIRAPTCQAVDDCAG